LQGKQLHESSGEQLPEAETGLPKGSLSPKKTFFQGLAVYIYQNILTNAIKLLFRPFITLLNLAIITSGLLNHHPLGTFTGSLYWFGPALGYVGAGPIPGAWSAPLSLPWLSDDLI
jgi:hypothetical protein